MKNKKRYDRSSNNRNSSVYAPERYVPFEQESSTILKSSYNLDKLKKFNEPHKVDEILAKYPQANVWLPLNATEKNMTVLINKEKGEVVKIVDLRPWK
ncbi:hypothetical protein ABFY41_00160 [Acinetobacter haemolyticus]|uniref:hypothetical protein n=1 Tax=Acinetobacter haemolyticus TaxID=29430 RepID=UPI003D1CBEDB